MLQSMMDWAEQLIIDGPDPRNGARPYSHFTSTLGQTITPEGMGWEQAFSLFTDEIVPSTRPFHHPTSLSFVAAAPSPASLGLDAALGAAEIFAGNWDGGSGAIYAENQALGWLARLAGWPESAGGVFVSGGTLGNLSALHAARVGWSEPRPDRFAILCSTEAHSSIRAVASVMDVDMVEVPTDPQGRIRLDEAAAALAAHDGIFAIVANAGATNCGAVDDLRGLTDLARQYGIWCHVDGAYGLAAMADPEARRLFDGIEQADSFVVDPHKWLFAPYDSCALVYRDPARRRRRTASAAPTSTPSTTTPGTPRTLRCTCHGGRGGCRSGSRWRPMASGPTPPPSARPSKPPGRSPRASPPPTALIWCWDHS